MESMPRFKIACNNEYFNILYDVIETADHDISQAAWNLVK